MVYGAPGVSGTEGPVFVRDQNSGGLYAADREPKPISLWRPPLPAEQQPQEQTHETLNLTIDEAGKVMAATLVAPRSDPGLLKAARHWKFIPAYSDGRPVAYRMNLDVQLIR